MVWRAYYTGIGLYRKRVLRASFQVTTREFLHRLAGCAALGGPGAESPPRSKVRCRANLDGSGRHDAQRGDVGPRRSSPFVVYRALSFQNPVTTVYARRNLVRRQQGARCSWGQHASRMSMSLCLLHTSSFICRDPRQLLCAVQGASLMADTVARARQRRAAAGPFRCLRPLRPAKVVPPGFSRTLEETR